MSQDVEAPRPEAVDERITAKDVARLTGLSARRIREAAAAGHLTAFAPPEGVRGLVKYSRASAEALARAMVRPASATSAPTEGDRPHA